MIALLQQQFVAYAQANYPFPKAPLPAFPAAEACNRFQNSSGSALQKLAAAVSLSLPTLKAKVATKNEKNSSCVQADLVEWHKFDPGFIPGAWTYQRCTEVVIADSHVLENSHRSQWKKEEENQKRRRIQGLKKGGKGKKRKGFVEPPTSYASLMSPSLFLPCSSDFQGNCWNLNRLRDFCDRIYQTGDATLRAPEWSRVEYGRGFLKGYEKVGKVLFTQGITPVTSTTPSIRNNLNIHS